MVLRGLINLNDTLRYSPAYNESYRISPAGGYDEKTDIILKMVKDSGSTTNPGTYYIEHVLVDKTKINSPLSTFAQT